MIHNQLTNYARLMVGFRRALGEMGADFSGIERAGESLTPVLDLWALPEWALLRGEIIYSRLASSPAGAAQYSSLELVNPTGSGILAVVLKYQNLAAQGVQLVVDTGPALGVVATYRGVANDTRWPQLGEVSRCTLVAGLQAGAASLPQDQVGIANATTTNPYILAPGKKLWIIGYTANNTVTGGLLWTERPILSTESGV